MKPTKTYYKTSYFNTNIGLSADFFQPTESGEEYLGKKALVACEGEFKDSNGRQHNFTPERLAMIAEHTNSALDKGLPLPLCVDHKKEFGSTVGNVEGYAYTKVIEPSDLPNEKATHLVGKVGLFLDKVVVKAQDAIDKVKKGIVTSVSMGLNLDPSDHRIMELSLVPISAIPNMGLFHQAAFGAGSDDSNAFTWEDLERTEQTLDDMKEEFDNLTENLWTILNNIYTSESIDITDLEMLKQYVFNALNGFSLRVVDLLGLSQVPDSPTEQPDTGTMTAEQAAQMNAIQAQDLRRSQSAIYQRGKRNIAYFSKYSRAPKYVRVTY